jgi:hypothetical protein
MITKNGSVISAKYILVSRKDHDTVLSNDQKFLQHLFATYRRSWALAGVKFYNVDAKDFVKLFKLLA